MLRLFFCPERIRRSTERFRKVENHLHSFVEIHTEPGSNVLSTLWKTCAGFAGSVFHNWLCKREKIVEKGLRPGRCSLRCRTDRCFHRISTLIFVGYHKNEVWFLYECTKKCVCLFTFCEF